ncbi:Ribosomal protein S18 acetylase RimI [Agreia pratensis]|uniref:Ribosomal protein S18 acetylase RimI n=1 Tax=Agreia pratensis TaxID=150121 RepID=A0A1X7KI19_9MICO|nr:Ribosomal protein S18 acetylase RimI [Agreia pratensis]
MRVRAGTTGDVDAAQSLMGSARRWLHEQSIDQWQDRVPDSTFEKDAERGHFFVVERHGAVIAMVTVADEDDETWPADDVPASYVHRLAVDSTHRGDNLGGRLLSWVEVRAQEAGKQVVRLDCAADNPGLRRFYEARGFSHVGDSSVSDPTGARSLKISLYEKRLDA